MNLPTFLIALVVAVLFVAAVNYSRTHGTCEGCSGHCGACGGKCRHGSR